MLYEVITVIMKAAIPAVAGANAEGFGQVGGLRTIGCRSLTRYAVFDPAFTVAVMIMINHQRPLVADAVGISENLIINPAVIEEIVKFKMFRPAEQRSPPQQREYLVFMVPYESYNFV